MVTELVDDGDDEGSAFHRAPARSAGAMAAWEQAAEADAASARGSACGPVAELNLVLAGMREVARSDWHAMPGRSAHEALDVVEQLDRTLDAMRSELLAAIDADKLWALDGQRTFPAWVRERTDVTAGAASRQVRTARALRDYLPLARKALAAGEISAEHAGVLVRETLRTDRLKAQLADSECGEEFLVAQGRVMDAGTYAKVVRAWAFASDPEAADRAWREADGKEEFTLAPTLGGYHVAGWLNEVSGQAVATALKAHMGRKGKGDERSPAQRRAAALVSLAHQSLDCGLQQAHARVRPHLTVTASLQTFLALVAASGSVVPPLRPDGQPFPPGAGFGITADATLGSLGGPRCPDAPPDDLSSPSQEARDWLQRWAPGGDHVIPAAIDHRAMTGVDPATLEDGTPIPPALLARLACGSGLSRVVFGPDSQVLDVGREQRIFPAHMVKAIIARDRHCQFPGCDEPPGFGEIHHALQWYRDGGPTSVDLGILLCWHHHDWVHAQAITITRAKGRWHFYHRNGLLITARHDPQRPGDSSAH